MLFAPHDVRVRKIKALRLIVLRQYWFRLQLLAQFAELLALEEELLDEELDDADEDEEDDEAEELGAVDAADARSRALAAAAILLLLGVPTAATLDTMVGDTLEPFDCWVGAWLEAVPPVLELAAEKFEF